MIHRLKVRGLITYENKALLCRLKNAPEFWCLPGGGLEEGEELRKGLQREILEELGIKSEIGQLLYIQQFDKEGDYNFPEFIFHVMGGENFKELDVSKTTHGVLELEELKFVNPKEVSVLPKFIADDWDKLVSTNFRKPITYLTISTGGK